MVMVEKIKSGIIECPVWVFMLSVPVLITIFLTMVTVIQNDATAQAKLQLQAEINKTNIKELTDKKVDKDAFMVFQDNMKELQYDVKEIKKGLDEHRATGK
jgi:hypothetical protein